MKNIFLTAGAVLVLAGCGHDTGDTTSQSADKVGGAALGALATVESAMDAVEETASNMAGDAMEVAHDTGESMAQVGEQMMTKEITLTEIAGHATKDDCWFAVNGMVYDVTPFIAKGIHPGGEAILEGCGKDATTLFETRPMGSGTPHSKSAHETREGFEIGTLTTL